MNLTMVPQLDRYDWARAWALRPTGQVLILAAFAMGLWLLQDPWWLEITAALTACTLLPAHRGKIIVAAMLYTLFGRAEFKWAAIPESYLSASALPLDRITPWAILIGLGIGLCFVAWARETKWGVAKRHPVALWVLALTGLIVLAGSIPLTADQGVWFWAVIIVVCKLLWFVAYSLKTVSRPTTAGPFGQMGYWLPFWGSFSQLPVPKGWDYLHRIEAKDAEALALSQLKGLKLLIWAVLLYHGQWLVSGWGDGVVPTYGEALRSAAGGRPYDVWENWAALFCSFLDELLYFTIWGHKVVAVVRGAGYLALRNTYKPLAARSIADFWNRYIYYFKELMAEMFFYPTYFRFFKNHPRLRLFVATFAAAGFGNALFHFLNVNDLAQIAEKGLWGALVDFQNYLVYCALLGLGIAFSQLRHGGGAPPPPSGLLDRVLTPLGVLGFYGLVFMFDTPYQSTRVVDVLTFAQALIGAAP